MKKVYYFDYNATTPVHSEVLEAMMPFFKESYGNPSSVHTFGRETRAAVDSAREMVAKILGADASEIVFTSCGSESNNLVLKGLVSFHCKAKNHIITSCIEHPAILSTCSFLEESGYRITYLPVNENGRINLSELKEAITDQTLIISIMHGNNEIGVIQPISEIGGIAGKNGVFFHTDAVQTVGKIPIDVNKINVDFLSLSAHKFYGPKGAGALYVRRGIDMHPLIHGGHQEKSRRAGTENVAGIVGLGKACEIAMRDMDEEFRHLVSLKEKFCKGLMEKIPKIRINCSYENCMPNTLNVGFLAIEGESLLINLDLKGIAVSTGSACSSGSVEPSHVLRAIGVPVGYIQGSLRFSFGRFTTSEDIDYLLEILPPIVEKLRSMSPLWDG
ncbi:MAG: cysteine desulfurase NifS [Candidatus Schekmanbacteria bacterium RIFCSPHIGHO2_02_FULL_38_11]|uniref:Cysteine desulfurase IscS n=1 Tax=Candidatus Schekmanbacteria bacterium RIFCSPLOWO2_12_FULL_38_15 TaxID=1817883 RepID=A0A1F7SLI2_9BACT|nr:MAG: cysteine desulfurase NifS [Candidatus Schekmanbacteria bacterium GWA2_38_9]OGL52418.1 MAG: cysteine desulfurase NifS [Candidatus Schekmanbacteria bacterium RIFCSPHIGHO2_02_FULL_38_11]OGL54074.1 MAG: cysteine desulfurase NifS [Candidatus Schekmanbacteria bacterium RIFCSPLOWO2_12_FULL_38_15]